MQFLCGLLKNIPGRVTRQSPSGATGWILVLAFLVQPSFHFSHSFPSSVALFEEVTAHWSLLQALLSRELWQRQDVSQVPLIFTPKQGSLCHYHALFLQWERKAEGSPALDLKLRNKKATKSGSRLALIPCLGLVPGLRDPLPLSKGSCHTGLKRESAGKHRQSYVPVRLPHFTSWIPSPTTMCRGEPCSM